MENEALLIRTLVELADTLTDHFDVVDLLTLLSDRCAQVLDVAAGIMLVSSEGDLRVVASSTDAMRLVELFELQSDEGPCIDCFRAAAPVSHADLEDTVDIWPNFARVALDAGFRSAHALPMRLRGSVIGALNLFRTEVGGLDDAATMAAQALADIATIAILQHRVGTEALQLNEQLNAALSSRIVIEQAKGVIAERVGVATEEAFRRLRTYARSHNLLLADVAREVAAGKMELETFGTIETTKPKTGSQH
jgi:GAF domain-containing protein